MDSSEFIYPAQTEQLIWSISIHPAESCFIHACGHSSSDYFDVSNRQAYKDRLSAEHDYEVNLKSELEIIALHEKVDSLKQEQWKELISIQEEQLKLLGQLVEDLKKDKQKTG